MTLHIPDDVKRGISAITGEFIPEPEWEPALTRDVTAVLDATLPAIRQRWLRELADECYDDEIGQATAYWLRHKADEVTP